MKTKFRKEKTAQIGRISRLARRLYSGSVFSASTWGHPACGVSETQIHQLENDALAAAGITSAGRCRPIALAVAYGVLGTPRARIIRETFRVWFDVYRTLIDSDADMLRQAWADAKQEFQSYGKSVFRIKGLLSNMVYILLSAGWDPISIDCWFDPKGEAYRLARNVSPDIAAAAVIKTYFNNELAKADQG